MFRTILPSHLQVPKLTPALVKNIARRGKFTLKTEAAGLSETLALCTKKTRRHVNAYRRGTLKRNMSKAS